MNFPAKCETFVSFFVFLFWFFGYLLPQNAFKSTSLQKFNEDSLASDLNKFSRAVESGNEQWTNLSMRPDRKRAGSSKSGRDVAATCVQRGNSIMYFKSIDGYFDFTYNNNTFQLLNTIQFGQELIHDTVSYSRAVCTTSRGDAVKFIEEQNTWFCISCPGNSI